MSRVRPRPLDRMDPKDIRGDAIEGEFVVVPESADSIGWDALRQKVWTRDWGCIVPQVDPSEQTPCKGMPTLDHVPARGENALGKKAPDDEAHLVTVCTYHHTGRLWPERNRELERAYLAKFWPAIHGERQ